MTMKVSDSGVLRDATPEEIAEHLASEAAYEQAKDPLSLPIEPAPFWNAVFDLFGMRDTDVLDAIEDPDQRYLAANSISRRKTYLRDNPTFIQLAALKGYTDPAEVDTLWRYIQTNYS